MHASAARAATRAGTRCCTRVARGAGTRFSPFPLAPRPPFARPFSLALQLPQYAVCPPHPVSRLGIRVPVSVARRRTPGAAATTSTAAAAAVAVPERTARGLAGGRRLSRAGRAPADGAGPACRGSLRPTSAIAACCRRLRLVAAWCVFGIFCGLLLRLVAADGARPPGG